MSGRPHPPLVAGNIDVRHAAARTASSASRHAAVATVFRVLGFWPACILAWGRPWPVFEP